MSETNPAPTSATQHPYAVSTSAGAAVQVLSEQIETLSNQNNTNSDHSTATACEMVLSLNALEQTVKSIDSLVESAKRQTARLNRAIRAAREEVAGGSLSDADIVANAKVNGGGPQVKKSLSPQQEQQQQQKKGPVVNKECVGGYLGTDMSVQQAWDEVDLDCDNNRCHGRRRGNRGSGEAATADVDQQESVWSRFLGYVWLGRGGRNREGEVHMMV